MATPRAQRDRYIWDGIAFSMFAVLCAVSVGLIYRYGEAEDFGAFGFFDLLALGLAAFRLIHLITFDKILDFARAAVMDSEGGRLTSADRGWRRAICELIQCIWCAGLWSALVVVTAYLLGRWGRLAILMLAVAGLGSLLQVVSKGIAGREKVG